MIADGTGCFRASYSGTSKRTLTLTGKIPEANDCRIRAVIKQPNIRRFVLMIRDSVMEGIEWHSGYRDELSRASHLLSWDLQAHHREDGSLMFALSRRNRTCPAFWDHVCLLTEDEARELAAFLGYVLHEIQANPGQDLRWESEGLF